MKNSRALCWFGVCTKFLFVTLVLLLVSFALFEFVFRYATFYEDPTEKHVIVITNETAMAKETNSRCTFHTCFEVYNCGSSENKLIKVYVYPEFEYIDQDGHKIVPFMSKEFEELISSIISSKYYTNDPDDACLFIPQIDFLNQEKILSKQSSQLLSSLPYWNEGKNHLLFNMLPGFYPHFFTSLEVDRDKAIMVGGGFSTWSYRRTFDVSIPVFNALTANVVLNDVSDNKRQWLLVSSQVGLHSDYIKELEVLKSKNSDLLLLRGCKQFNIFERCDMFERVYQYPQILQEATFCLVLRGNRLGQMELLDCMRAGSIPVVMADTYVMPFFDVLEWKRAAVILSELELPRLTTHLRKISKKKIAEMRRQAVFFHRKYFESVATVAMTTLKVINDRVFPHFASSHEEWNDAEPKLKSPFFLPMVVPKTTGFTAVILTYDRLESLFKLIQQVAMVPSLAKVLVIWNSQQKTPPPAHNWPKINKPLKVIQTQHNRLSNRFYPYQEIETEAVLSIDDDILMLTPDEIEFAFKVWCEFPDRIVGFPSRLHKWDKVTSAWRYESEWMSKLSMVLTGAAFYHKHYNYIYTDGMPAGLKELADGWMNCEDIAFNFMVTYATGKPPIKVTPRQKFRCPECGNLTALSGDLGDHMFERSKCINKFTEMYKLESPPLIPVELRADPVLYKNQFPPPKYRMFNDVGSL